MNIKSYLKPWVLISIGIAMNIISAVMTHYFISENNAELNAIETKISNITSNIEQQWQSKTELERKKEFVLLLLNSHNNQPLNPEIKTYLLHHLSVVKEFYLNDKSKTEELSIQQTIEITEKAQNKLIKEISDQYFNKLELESEKEPLSANNALLYSIAIFMQLIGLILVLSRDLARQ